MKKTMIALMALVGVAMAAEPVTLSNGMVAYWTFDDGSTDYVSYTGATAGFNTGITDANKVAEGGIDGNGYISTYANNHRIDFYNGLGAFNVDANDFTISMKVRNLTADYRTVLSFNLGSTQCVLQTANSGNGSGIWLYGAGIDMGNNTNGQLKGDTWANVIVTGSNGTLTMYINDLDGTASYTVDNGTKLSNLQFGSQWGDGGRAANVDLDDIAIWNRVLNSTEIAVLRAGSTAPEPATATLSLLALAGLASRRRRH